MAAGLIATPNLRKCMPLCHMPLTLTYMAFITSIAICAINTLEAMTEDACFEGMNSMIGQRVVELAVELVFDAPTLAGMYMSPSC